MKTTMAMVLGAACMIASSFSANVIAASAGTKDNYHEVVNAKSEEAFSQLAESVRKEMAAGGRYEFVKPAERADIDKNLAAMTALFREKGSVDRMSDPQKVALFNSQEVVNSILTKRDSDRVICENRVPVGSHIPKTTCHTFGQEEEARRGTDQEVSALKHPQCMSASPTDNHCGGR
jgi:hypothetical protein